MKKVLLTAILTTGVTIFAANQLTTCEGCHGSHFQKHALGKSKIVKDMSKKEIIHALNGYKKGNFGGSLKMIMEAQAAKIKNVNKTANAVYQLNHKNSTENKPLTKEDKKCQKKCSAKLENIKNCVISANNQSSIYKCRVSLIKLAKKIQKKFHVTY